MKVVMVIAQQGFRDEEYFETRNELERASIQVATASFKSGVCQGSQGGAAEAELSLIDIKVADFDAVVFVGGQGMVGQTKDEDLVRLAKDFFQAGKLTAAICIAPEILAYAGLLKERRAVCTPLARSVLQAQGAKLAEQKVVKDGRLITAEGPTAAKEFGSKIAEALQAGRQD